MGCYTGFSRISWIQPIYHRRLPLCKLTNELVSRWLHLIFIIWSVTVCNALIGVSLLALVHFHNFRRSLPNFAITHGEQPCCLVFFALLVFALTAIEESCEGAHKNGYEKLAIEKFRFELRQRVTHVIVAFANVFSTQKSTHSQFTQHSFTLCV